MLLEVIVAMKFSVSGAVSLSTVKRRHCVVAAAAAAAEASSTARCWNKLHSRPDGREKMLVRNSTLTVENR